MKSYYLEKENERFNGNAECGYAFYESPPSIVRMHTHTFYELFMIIEGEIVHEVNGQLQQLKKGNVVFVRDSDIHRLQPPKNVCKWVNVHFSKNTFKSLVHFLGHPDLEKTLLAPTESPVIQLPDTQATHCIKKLSLMHNISQKNNYFFKLEVRKQLLYIFSTFFVKTDKRYFLPDWLDTLCAKMREFENCSVGTSRMYELNPRSKSHLIKSMQQYLNTTVSNFVNEQRLHFATDFLVNSNEPIIDIALDCGFNSINYFYRLFKKVHGISPKAYREKFSTIANLTYQNLQGEIEENS